MSEYKPMVPISLNTAWKVADLMDWMNENPIMDIDQKQAIAAMVDELQHNIEALYQEREEKSLYFKALVDDMPDDIVAMIEHEYGVKDLLELNEKQLGEAVWYAVQSGLLKDMGVDKLVCLEKRPGKAPRVRLVGHDAESFREIIGAEYLGMELMDDVVVFRAKENQDNDCELTVGTREGTCISMTEQQVKELVTFWGYEA